MNSLTEEERQTSEYHSNHELLISVPFFSGIPVDSLKLLAYLCTRESFKPGTTIFAQDELDEHAYYLLSGKAYLIFSDSGLDVTVRTYEAGDFIGILSLLCKTSRIFSLRAETPVECLVISREVFQKTFERFPSILERVFETVCLELHNLERHLANQLVRVCPESMKAMGISLI